MSEQPGVDPVVEGMREWERVKRAAVSAEERAAASAETAAQLRGENGILREANGRLEREVRQLRAENDEVRLHIGAAAQMIMDLMQKVKAAPFRKPGTVTVGKDDGPAAVDAGEPASVVQLDKLATAIGVEAEAASLGAKHGADNPRRPDWMPDRSIPRLPQVNEPSSAT